MNLLIGILQHNKYNITIKCIDRILEHTKNINFSIYLVDNNSSDNSYFEVCNKFEKLECFKSKINSKNYGVIGGRNLIFQYFSSQEEYTDVLFLDNDQFVNKDWENGYIDSRSLDDYSIIGIEAWLLGHHLAPVRKCIEKDIFFSYVGCGGMMIPRKSYAILGNFDDNYNPAYFEDPDYCLRAKDNDINVVWNRISKIDHLAHQTLGSNVINSASSFKNSLNYFKKKWRGKYVGGALFKV